jgi:hypothetical protein
LEIIEVKNGKELKKFIDFPYSLYAKDPLYAPVLKREVRTSGREEPFKHAEVKYFVAGKRGNPWAG